MPLSYLSIFAVIIRGIHGNVPICQTDYSIHYKSEFSPYSEVMHESTTLGKRKVKKG